MPTLQEVLNDKDSSLFYLFKGEPGSRKATHALSFPKPQYWFNWDQKMRFALRPMKDWGVKPEEVHYDNYSDWQGARVKLEKFQVTCPYKTIVIKTITSAGDAINRQTLKVKYGTTTSSGQEAGKRIGGIAVNTIEDFNAETSAFQELIALCKDIKAFHKINIILIAHVIQIEQKSSAGMTTFSRSLVTGGKKVAAKIPAYCDEVYHFNLETDIDISKGGKYAILTQSTGDDFARTTLPLPSKIILEDKPLYETHILPAILKQQEQEQTTTKF